MKRIIPLLVFVFSSVSSGCIMDQGQDLIESAGTVKFIALEGGFYGIIGDDGKKYDPVNLATEYRQDGLRIRFTAKPAKDQVSFHMWGELIEILTIERL